MSQSQCVTVCATVCYTVCHSVSHAHIEYVCVCVCENLSRCFLLCVCLLMCVSRCVCRVCVYVTYTVTVTVCVCVPRSRCVSRCTMMCVKHLLRDIFMCVSRYAGEGVIHIPPYSPPGTYILLFNTFKSQVVTVVSAVGYPTQGLSPRGSRWRRFTCEPVGLIFGHCDKWHQVTWYNNRYSRLRQHKVTP